MPTRTTIFATNDVLTANDLNSLAGAWNSYTPRVDQGTASNITKTIVRAKYLQFGKLVICQVRLSITGAGASGTIVMTVPHDAVSSGFSVGAGSVTDASAVLQYGAIVELNSVGTFQFFRSDAPAAGRIGVDPSFTLASGDVIDFIAVYEAA